MFRNIKGYFKYFTKFTVYGVNKIYLIVTDYATDYVMSGLCSGI